MNKKLWIVVGITLILGIVLFGVSKNKTPVATGPIKIGSVLPITGDFAFFGGEILRGAQIAIEEAQKSNPDIKFINEDDHSDAKSSVNAANKLTSIDKVDGVITATLQEVKPMASIFSNGSIPLLATWDSNDYIKTAGKNIFTIGFSTEYAGQIMADHAYNTLKLRNVAVMSALDEWSTIIANDGSVQHLDWMDDWTKDVFKTSMEIDQRWLVQHAADRQQYIDQAQSLNLFFRPDVHIKYLHAIHFMAWKKGLKTLYYCRSEKIGKADKVAKKIEREVIKEIDMTQIAQGNDCIACEG